MNILQEIGTEVIDKLRKIPGKKPASLLTLLDTAQSSFFIRASQR